MTGKQPIFDLVYNGKPIKVKEQHVHSQVLFIVQFSDKTPNLVVTRASGTEIGKHWTSIPEGRLKEAEDIGQLIAAYIKKNS